jgi:hypothetical protein
MSTLKVLLFAVLPCLLAAQTTVTLTTTPNPSRFGAPVVLRASVTTAGGGFSLPATGGVTFYDGVTVLGTAPIVSGAASLSTIQLQAGTRKLKAYYAGDASNSPATSNVVTQTVNAVPVSNFAYGADPAPFANFTADFNGDGIADITAGVQPGVFLGDGHGGFRQSFTFPTGFVISVGDFNGDGKPDLVISDGATLRVLMGNGDGAFQAPVNTTVTIPSNTKVTAVVSDFNGDGKADLAGTFGILLGNGDGTFQSGAGLVGAGIVSLIVAGDFNGDGIPDLATSDGLNSLNILLGNGDGTFRPAIQIPVPGSTSSLTAADFNGDGKDDLAAIWFKATNEVLEILLSNGDGTFQTGSYPVTRPSRAVAGDFNGDGKIDLILNDSILAGNGDGTFQPLFSFSPNDGSSPLILDLNGDGKPDILFSFSLLLGTAAEITPSGGTPQSAAVGTQFATPLEVSVRDDNGLPANGVVVRFSVNGAGSPQANAALSSYVVTTNASGIASVTATANNVPGGYTVQALYESRIVSFSLTNVVGPPASLTALSLPQSTLVDTPFPKPLAVSVKDLGGNPVSGVAVTFRAPQSGASAVLSGATAVTDASGTASVTATANHTPGSYSVTATAGTFSAGFSLSNTLALPSTITLASAASTSVFGAPVLLTATITPSSATGRVTFYDGVTILGTKPLSAGTASLSTILLPAGTRKLRAFYSGDGSFVSSTSNGISQRVNAAAGGSFVQAPLNVPPGGRPVAADFNGDGRADIAYSTGSTVAVLLGKGDGSFQAPIQSTGAGNYIAVGDFNGDGIPDIYAGTVLLGNGNGTFRQGSSYPGLDYPVSVTDFNGDGNADLLAGNTILLGHGDGTFTPQSFFVVPSAVTIIQSNAGDFNGDGKPDIVVLGRSCVPYGGPISGGNNCTDSLDLYPGNGDGTFLSQIQVASTTYNVPNFGGFPGAPRIKGFAVEDFNGDGKQDLLYWGAGSAVLLGNGDGTFGPAQIFDSAATALITGDFNGDGVTDLAVGNADSSFSTLTGRGDGTFQPTGSAYFGSNSISALSVADFNGDGKADLIVADINGTIRVFLGAAPGTGLTITATGGTPQSAGIGALFNAPLEVTLRNNGVPVIGASVTFAAPGGAASATLSSTTAITNASGVASVTATANQNPGTYVVTARSQGVGTSFTLTNIGISAVASPQTQSVPVGTAFPAALKVTVTSGSQPTGVPGLVVTFTAPASGASAVLSSPTAVTDASGVASVRATANGITGAYAVFASVGSAFVSFSLTNTPAGGGATNLALGKTASQSSTLPTTPAASAAVDGNTDGAFYAGSVTATNLEANPWWQVDLGTSTSVGSVTIWNRTDCCASRLSDYWLFISNTPFLSTDTPATLQNRAGVFASHQTSTPNPSAMIAAGVQGRYVRVQLSSADYLSLAEVQVLGTGTPSVSNLAQGKPATQSSTIPGAPTAAASSAVDGNTDGSFYDGSVTATNADANAWWQVDLGASATMSSIVIWNRTDCCASRLSDYWVFVSDTPFLTTDTPDTLQNRAGTFASHQTTAPNPSTTIATVIHPCPPAALCPDFLVQGRYVRIQLSSPNYLSLAEVQVFGTGGSAPPAKVASQSSTLPGTPPAGAAIDGNTDGNFYDGSVTATNLENNAWWQVDLGAAATVNSVTIWNRTDCCGTRLSDYWVFVSNTPFQGTDTPATLQNRAGTFASHQTTAPNPSAVIPVGVSGRYVRVQLSSPNYLSLAEVQVFAQ